MKKTIEITANDFNMTVSETFKKHGNFVKMFFNDEFDIYSLELQKTAGILYCLARATLNGLCSYNITSCEITSCTTLADIFAKIAGCSTEKFLTFFKN